jgi:hypothetical protein
MRTRILVVMVIAGLTGAASSAAAKLQLKDLPAAVQKTVQDNLKGGEIRAIEKEKERGVEQYEIESVLNGKARDFNVDAKGTLLVMEEETTLDKLPDAARAAILQKVSDGKLGLVECVQVPGTPATYEASYTDRSGRKHSVAVKADGTTTK